MKTTEEKSSLEKVREAWSNMPPGVKGRLYGEDFGYTKQNVADILKNGRRDETTILKLLADIKQASMDEAAVVSEQNEMVQAI